MQLRLLKSVKNGSGWKLPGQVHDFEESEAVRLIKKKAAIELVTEVPEEEPVEEEEVLDGVEKTTDETTDESTEESTENSDNAADDEEFTPADELCQIDGVHTDIANALVNVGYETLDLVANATPADLEKISGIGSKSAPKIIQSAKELCNQ